MRLKQLVLSLIAIVGFPCAGLAQMSSGPNVGDAVKGFKVFAATGEKAGNEVDFVSERKDLPTVYLFVQSEHWSRPNARFMRDLDEALAKGVEGAEGVQAVAVWLSDDFATARDYLPRAQQSLQFQKTTLAAFDGQKTGPAAWSVNDQAHLTVVVVRGGKAVASRGYISLNETDVPDVLKALQKQ